MDGREQNSHPQPLDEGNKNSSASVNPSPDGLNAPLPNPVHDATLSGPENVHASDNLLAAVAAISFDVTSNIDHALDQLTTSTNLFDVPVLDFGTGALGPGDYDSHG